MHIPKKRMSITRLYTLFIFVKSNKLIAIDNTNNKRYRIIYISSFIMQYNKTLGKISYIS